MVDEFCTLTGMQLNLQKTVSFATGRRHRPTLKLRSVNALLQFRTSAVCLGSLISTARGRNERCDSERAEGAAALADGLRHAPFRYEQRVRIVQSTVLPSALSSCCFAPVSKKAMKKLTTSVMGLVWGGANPKRAREMVLNFQEKGHLTDPQTCLAYKVVTGFYTTCERMPELLPMVEDIRERYTRGALPLGPVGLALRSMEECGHVWEEGPLSRVRRQGAQYNPMCIPLPKRGHDIRADLRAKTWEGLIARRPGFQGVQEADLERTNGFWKLRGCPAHKSRLLRVALAGGVNTSDYTSRMGQGAQTPNCRHCGCGDVEDESHIFWHCDAYAGIRRREVYHALVATDRSGWPRCTLEHGVVVRCNAHHAKQLHEMMAEILAERARLEGRIWMARNRSTPWSRAAAMSVKKLDFPFQRIAPAWAWERNRAWGLKRFRALVAWLGGLEWTERGQVSMLELAVDFELFSGLEVPLRDGTPRGVKERGNVFRCMLSALEKLSGQQGMGSCLLGNRICRTTSLSSLGILGLTGMQPRPRFRDARTGTVIDTQERGSDVLALRPVYPDWPAGRQAQWDEPAPPQQLSDPVHVPGAELETRALGTCIAHHKTRCGPCRALNRRDVPTVEMCCQHHHSVDDGLPVAACSEHRMTKCGECPTPAACCRSGHHVCHAHGRGTCDVCLALPTLAERRPAACCRRGHHQADRLSAPMSPEHKRKPKRPPPSSPDYRAAPARKRKACARPAPPAPQPMSPDDRATVSRTAHRVPLKRPPPTPTTTERLKRTKVALKASPVPRKRKRPKTATPATGPRRSGKAQKAGSAQPTSWKPSTGNMLASSLASLSTSSESRGVQATLNPQVLDLDDSIAGDDVIK